MGIVYGIYFKEYGIPSSELTGCKVYKDKRTALGQLGVIKAESEGTKYKFYDKDSYTSKLGDTWEIKELELV